MKRFVPLWMAFLFSIGWITEVSVRDGYAQTTPQADLRERYEALVERVNQLERSVSTLGAELISLEDRLNRVRPQPRLIYYKLPKEVTICGERIPLEDRKVWENLNQEFIAALGNEAQIILWMKRVRRYFPTIERRLRELSLPDDLKYVTITESALRPHAVSSSGAAGIWQFIPSTGEKYGMRGYGGIDERFDFFKATEGALSYLKFLYEEFRTWPVAIAAYNCGENRMRREIEFQRMRNYFYLDLPLETERYVYKIAVAKIILSDPLKYGFRLDEEEYYEPLRMDRIQVELSEPLPMIDLAVVLQVPYKEIKEMNLHVSGEVVPTGIQFLNLPAGTTERFKAYLLLRKESGRR